MLVFEYGQIHVSVMHPAFIKAEIEVRVGSLAAFGRLIHRSRGQVSNVVNKRLRSQAIENAICDLIERPLWEVFPEWYQGVAIPRK